MRNLKGKRFNKLKVLRLASSSRNGEKVWECLCDCGNTKTYSTDHLTRKSQPVKSCGCVRFYRADKHKDWKGYEGISGSWWCVHVLREIAGHKRRKVLVSLTIKKAWKLFIKQNKRCALTGVPLQFSSLGKYNTASLDRIDSSKGYTLKNVQWVHKHINFMKRTYTQDYFIDLCKKVYKYSKKNGVCGL